FLMQIRLHRRSDAADTDCGENAGRAADVGQFKTGDVLTLGIIAVRGAWASPVVAGVVREIEPGLGAGHDVIAVIWIYSHLAHRIVLRKLTRRFCKRRAKDICA